jgi:hypothetical protein
MENQSTLSNAGNVLPQEDQGGWTTPSGFTVRWQLVFINKSYDVKLDGNIAAYITGINGAYLVFNKQEPFKLKRAGVRVEHTKVSADTIRIKMVSTLSDGDGADIWPDSHGIIVIAAWLGASSDALFYNIFNPISSGGTSQPVSTGGRTIQSLVTALNSFMITLGSRDYIRSMTTNSSGKIESGETSITVSGVADMSTDGASCNGELTISAIAQLVDGGDYSMKLVQLESGDTAYGTQAKSVEVTFPRNVTDVVTLNASAFLDYINDTRAVSAILLGPSHIKDNFIYYNNVSYSGNKVTIKAAPTMYRTKWTLKNAYCSRIGTQDFLVLAKLAAPGEEATAGAMPVVKGKEAEYLPPPEDQEAK